MSANSGKIRAIHAKLKGYTKEKRKDLERGVKRASLFLLGESQKLVPVEFGILRASGFVRVTSGIHGEVIGTIGYTAEYAVYVHERLDLFHGADYNLRYADDIALGKKSSRGPNQQAKFLEVPAKLLRNELGDIIKDEIS